MKFKLEKKGNALEVTVEIKGRKYSRDPHCSVHTNNVLDFLVEEGYNPKEWRMVKEDVCSTAPLEQRLIGTWILEKKERRKNEEVTTKQQSSSVEQPKRPRRNTSRKKNQEDKLLGTENVGRVQSQAQTGVPGQNKKVSR